MPFRIASLSLSVLALLPTLVSANPVGLDGAIGAEWAGVSSVAVAYDALAPLGNFQAAGTTNHLTGYEIFMRSDANYLYTAVRTTGGGDASAVLGSNLYFALRYGTGPFGSAGGTTIGFEIGNNRAFAPGANGYYNDTAADLIRFASSEGAVDVFEAAIDMSVFTGNALGVAGYGLPAGETAAGIRLNLSQSFGYSVAGGASYGGSRLGFVSLRGEVPEPGGLALAGLALTALAVTRRKA
ncbi:MAG: hypothetical protein H7Z19_19865 [Chitinophagaceae bacterium]|nr:hypothetical protein [Rubrivivax sp.]